MSADRRLAQVNVARMRAGLDSAVMHGFMAAVDPIYRLAEAAPGFRWRSRAGGSHAVATVVEDGFALVVNVSVWESYEALHAFVYRGPHGGFVRSRSRWFRPTPRPSAALWWVGADERPTIEQALTRLRLLRRHGPSPAAFTMRRRFDRDGRPEGDQARPPADIEEWR